MGKITFEVLGAQWNGYPGGEHEVDDPDPDLIAAILGAEAAGVGVKLKEFDGERPDVVESDEDSLAAYEAAQADGRWQEGNLADAAAQREAGEEGESESESEEEGETVEVGSEDEETEVG